ILLYALLSVAVDRKEREVIEARLKEYAAVYRSGGLRALEASATQDENGKPFFVRVINPFNVVVFRKLPPDWTEVERKLALGPFQVRDSWMRIPRDEERDLLIVRTYLYDGSILQVGRSANKSRTLLQPFRRTFIAVVTPIILLGFIGGAVFAH